MKRFLLLLTVFTALSGCASVRGPLPLQRVLDQNFPKTFVGNAVVKHKNPWFDVTIRFTNLRHVDGVWQYDSAVYERNDRFTSGSVVLGPTP